MQPPLIRLAATVLGGPDPAALADFYQGLLGLERRKDEPGWVMLRSADGHVGLSFQEEDAYEPPVWPQQPGRQQMMVHLDIGTDDLDAAVARVLELGGRFADHQPQADVRVMLDPAGHPFCLFPWPDL
jgi:catechol 2,3-dioxygenase-like lactoylglutathione lyase family enzyme